MTLHPQCKAFLDSLAAQAGTPMWELPLAEARAIPLALVDLGGPQQQVAEVDDRTIASPHGAVPVRIFRPVAGTRLPAVMFFHGGGFVIGNLDSHDRQCRALANASGCTVIAVDYRLAPEHKFPAAPEDAYAATRYVADHPAEFNIDPDRLAVSGDSAGGSLAAVVALMARDRGGPALRFQLLIYPTVDWEDDSPSMREYAQEHFLTIDLIEWFMKQYLENAADARTPYASPLRARDHRGLPPAMIITAECDPLRDQGELYAQKLQNAGVAVELKRYEGMIHPFFSFGGVIDGGMTALDDAAAALRRALGATSTAAV